MAIFKSILRLIGVWFYRPIALESSVLGILPPELILYITRFLPPESTLSFSLCCLPIHSILQSQYIKIVKEDQHLDRYQFLTLLERDLPNHILCYFCKRLHAMKHAYQYDSNRRYANRNFFPCWKSNYNYLVTQYIHHSFSFRVFQMTMKLYRQGLNYSELLKLLSHQTEIRSIRGYEEHRTASSKIVAGSLLIRQQRRFMMPPAQQTTTLRDISFDICPHIQFESLKIVNVHRDITNRPYRKELHGYRNRNRLKKCKYCLTEFQIDFEEPGEQGYAMSFIKWQDLGQGLSPLDHKWQGHVNVGIDRPWKQVRFGRGSIYAAFERKEHIEFEFNNL